MTPRDLCIVLAVLVCVHHVGMVRALDTLPPRHLKKEQAVERFGDAAHEEPRAVASHDGPQCEEFGYVSPTDPTHRYGYSSCPPGTLMECLMGCCVPDSMCGGSCAAWVEDNVCDNGARNNLFFNCPMYKCDACGASNDTCIHNPPNACRNVFAGTHSAGGLHDPSREHPETCAPGQIAECLHGCCVDQDTVCQGDCRRDEGDGWCDAGRWGLFLNCPMTRCDGGDCSPAQDIADPFNHRPRKCGGRYGPASVCESEMGPDWACFYPPSLATCGTEPEGVCERRAVMHITRDREPERAVITPRTREEERSTVPPMDKLPVHAFSREHGATVIEQPVLENFCSTHEHGEDARVALRHAAARAELQRGAEAERVVAHVPVGRDVQANHFFPNGRDPEPFEFKSAYADSHAYPLRYIGVEGAAGNEDEHPCFRGFAASQLPGGACEGRVKNYPAVGASKLWTQGGRERPYTLLARGRHTQMWVDSSVPRTMYPRVIKMRAMFENEQGNPAYRPASDPYNLGGDSYMERVCNAWGVVSFPWTCSDQMNIVVQSCGFVNAYVSGGPSWHGALRRKWKTPFNETFDLFGIGTEAENDENALYLCTELIDYLPFDSIGVWPNIISHEFTHVIQLGWGEGPRSDVEGQATFTESEVLGLHFREAFAFGHGPANYMEMFRAHMYNVPYGKFYVVFQMFHAWMAQDAVLGFDVVENMIRRGQWYWSPDERWWGPHAPYGREIYDFYYKLKHEPNFAEFPIEPVDETMELFVDFRLAWVATCMEEKPADPRYHFPANNDRSWQFECTEIPQYDGWAATGTPTNITSTLRYLGADVHRLSFVTDPVIRVLDAQPGSTVAVMAEPGGVVRKLALTDAVRSGEIALEGSFSNVFVVQVNADATLEFLTADEQQTLRDNAGMWHRSETGGLEGHGHAWWCADEEIGGYLDRSYTRLQTIDALQLPPGGEVANITLSMDIAYAVEAPGNTPFDAGSCVFDGWDGVNVQISTDLGHSWTVIHPFVPLHPLGNGTAVEPVRSAAYTSQAVFGFSVAHGLCDMPGWTGSSEGDYVHPTFDLTPYAGQFVKIAVVFAADAAQSTPQDASLTGVHVDNVVVESYSTIDDSVHVLLHDDADENIALEAYGLKIAGLAVINDALDYMYERPYPLKEGFVVDREQSKYDETRTVTWDASWTQTSFTQRRHEWLGLSAYLKGAAVINPWMEIGHVFTAPYRGRVEYVHVPISRWSQGVDGFSLHIREFAADGTMGRVLASVASSDNGSPLLLQGHVDPWQRFQFATTGETGDALVFEKGAKFWVTMTVTSPRDSDNEAGAPYYWFVQGLLGSRACNAPIGTSLLFSEDMPMLNIKAGDVVHDPYAGKDWVVRVRFDEEGSSPDDAPVPDRVCTCAGTTEEQTPEMQALYNWPCPKLAVSSATYDQPSAHDAGTLSLTFTYGGYDVTMGPVRMFLDDGRFDDIEVKTCHENIDGNLCTATLTRSVASGVFYPGTESITLRLEVGPNDYATHVDADVTILAMPPLPSPSPSSGPTPTPSPSPSPSTTPTPSPTATPTPTPKVSPSPKASDDVSGYKAGVAVLVVLLLLAVGAFAVVMVRYRRLRAGRPDTADVRHIELA